MKAIIRLANLGLLFILCTHLYACTEDDTLFDDSYFPLIQHDAIDNNLPNTYIAIFGDIQYYTNSSFIGLYQYSIDWIRRKSNEGYQFNCVLHTGDITQTNKPEQYYYFHQATEELARQVPYFSMIGNHDYTWEKRKINDRNSTLFNDYVQFPLSVEKVIAWYEEGKMENIVVENTIYGQRLDLLILEFGPREEVVEWADAYVKSHPDHLFILMNHEYLENGGGRRTVNITSEIHFSGTSYSYTTPEQLWNRLIRSNDNIRVILCGHVGGLYAITVDVNDYGREIPQIQHNIQSSEHRYDNWLMLWDFPAESDSANVIIYNTRTGQLYDNKESLFKFRYRDFRPNAIEPEIHASPTQQEYYTIDGRKVDTPINDIYVSKRGNAIEKIFKR